MADNKLNELLQRWTQSESDEALNDLMAAVRDQALKMTAGIRNISAEDIAQDVAIVVFNKLRSFNPVDHPKFDWWVRSIIARSRKGSARGVLRRREDEFVEDWDFGGSDTQFLDVDRYLRTSSRSLDCSSTAAPLTRSLRN